MDDRAAVIALAIIAPLSVVAIVALLRGYSIKLWRDYGKDDDA